MGHLTKFNERRNEFSKLRNLFKKENPFISSLCFAGTPSKAVRMRLLYQQASLKNFFNNVQKNGKDYLFVLKRLLLLLPTDAPVVKLGGTMGAGWL